MFKYLKWRGFLNLIFGYFGGVGKLPYISGIHTAKNMFSDSSILGTCLKSLVTLGQQMFQVLVIGGIGSI